MHAVIRQMKAARKALRMKQRELGAKLGLPQSHVSSIERGETDPRLSTALDMARLLDHEIMLVPRRLAPYVESLLREEGPDARMWRPDEESGKEEE
jgi:HTH-type transcriptional regulator/antitoxin HipB